MKITKGDIFYRYADDTNAEDEIQEVELYVALDSSTDRQSSVVFMNLETEEGYKIQNGKISSTDLIKLTPDYYMSFKDNNDHNMCMAHIYSESDIKIDRLYLESEYCYFGTIGQKKTQLSIYTFLSRTFLDRICKYCLPTLYQSEDINGVKYKDIFIDNVIECSGSIIKEVDLPNTIIVEGRLQNLYADNMNDEHPQVKEFEDAIRYFIDPDDYVLLPFTPQFEVDKINRIHKIVRLNNDELYILIYTPLKSYIEYQIETDDDVKEIYRYMMMDDKTQTTKL